MEFKTIIRNRDENENLFKKYKKRDYSMYSVWQSRPKRSPTLTAKRRVVD